MAPLSVLQHIRSKLSPRPSDTILWQVAIEHSISLKDTMEKLLERHGNDHAR
jgi:hypothetical protein